MHTTTLQYALPGFEIDAAEDSDQLDVFQALAEIAAEQALPAAPSKSHGAYMQRRCSLHPDAFAPVDLPTADGTAVRPACKACANADAAATLQAAADEAQAERDLRAEQTARHSAW